MKTDYTIHVSQRDINEGVREQSAHCIVATAIGRQIPEATHISVAVPDIRFSVGDKRLIYDTPQAVRDYIVAFDAGVFGGLKPLTLTLTHPLVTRRSLAKAPRLVVRGQATVGQKVPSRTRAFGQRVFQVNKA